ncbi:hypothetical protein P7K49_014591 [Saguinus oedipus]|uniref:Uncharacterized protein n=1 Tax=Saguinus oedipus TaxID=9490 RepID=A0ABQ9V6S7_SAGOE|nr:hypothetical protein P7K49_014591 [Saguinus oedipus]
MFPWDQVQDRTGVSLSCHVPSGPDPDKDSVSLGCHVFSGPGSGHDKGKDPDQDRGESYLPCPHGARPKKVQGLALAAVSPRGQAQVRTVALNISEHYLVEVELKLSHAHHVQPLSPTVLLLLSLLPPQLCPTT